MKTNFHFGLQVCLFFVFVTSGLGERVLALQPVESYYVSKFPVMCRKEVNGETLELPVEIKLNPDPINNPNAPNTYGTCRVVLGNDRVKSNCKNEKYDYMEINIDENWVAIRGGVTFNHADNKAYWDNYYRGYDGPVNNKCDYSQNCHGHAFGVGDWPADASVGVILNLSPPNTADRCYKFSSVKDATIACGEGHTIRVVGKECTPIALPAGGGGCELSILRFNYLLAAHYWQQAWNSPIFAGCELLAILKQEQEPDPGDPEVGGIEIYIHSSEQFRESGTYTQTSTCECGSVDINLAHSRAGEVGYIVLGFEIPGYLFVTFKPNAGENEP